jgi:hypothetical protein
MPTRMLHESACTSLKLGQISDSAEVLFYRLLTKADDHGRYFASVPIVTGQCVPLKKWKIGTVEKALQELDKVGLIKLYEVGGERYMIISKWKEHQRIRAEKSRFPDPADTCGQLRATAVNCGHMLTNAPVDVDVDVDVLPPISPQGGVDAGKDDDMKVPTEYMTMIEAHTENKELRQAICEWFLMRKGKGKRYAVNTPYTLKLTLDKAKKIFISEVEQIAGFNEATEKGWQTVFAHEQQGGKVDAGSLPSWN